MRIVLPLVCAVGLAFLAAFPDPVESFRSTEPTAQAPSTRADTAAPPGGWPHPTWENPGGWSVIDVSEHGIRPNGTNIAPKIERLLRETEEPALLSFESGTYTLTSQLDISRDAVWFRGAGANRTRFRLVGEEPHSISFRGSIEASRSLARPTEAGDTEVELSSPNHGLQPGSVVEVRQRIPEDVPHYEGPPEGGVQDWGQWGYAFMAHVQAVDGNVVTLDDRFPLSFSPDHRAELRVLDPIRTVRIEGIAFERTVSNRTSTLLIRNADNVLVTDIASLKTARYHLMLSRSLDAVVRGSYFADTFVSGGGGEGYGVNLNSSTSRALVTNNIFRELRHHVLMQIGANRSVISYNYTVGFKGEEDFSVHGHYTHHVLFEGNRGARWGLGDWWGPTGPGFVLFRNRIRGMDNGDGNRPVGVMLRLALSGQQIVGNDFSEKAEIWYRNGHSAARHSVRANRLGGVWTERPDLPPSLNLDSRPDFWPPTLAWPPYGPDVPGSATNEIPAERRWNARGEGLPVESPVPLDSLVHSTPEASGPSN